MENNNRKFDNPIARARAQAHLNKTSSNNNDIDIFGNTEPIHTSKPQTDTDDEFQSFTPISNADNSSVFPQEEPLDLNSFGESTTNTTVTQEPLDSQPAQTETEQTYHDLDVDLPDDEEPKKAKKAKREKEPKQPKEKTERVRVINSKDAVITPEDIKASRGYAWLAYILFFIPLCINRNNEFVRHNANEGLEIFIFDVLAVVLILLNQFLKVSSMIGEFVILIGGIVGVGLLILTTITKIYMIIVSLAGKRCNTPWFWNIRIIK